VCPLLDRLALSQRGLEVKLDALFNVLVEGEGAASARAPLPPERSHENPLHRFSTYHSAEKWA
jgi:hypothetical protein